ncbi:hypothetical protein PHLGIDRAFT_199426 [Phlebiopsis gigantea 11061_1 CR5-6]|uniref:Uncharacterized protein n=1 Tax=Phlebiopsis gigantea (strain 11061_1 CR5-6) TaxID=745531 RepID=A0A0C3S3E6_PHLG1|nr:hypothetical protein PHLGIDRAFT_199426 [Phlebiopsis gigantea 11061_1 CR5-6]
MQLRRYTCYYKSKYTDSTLLSRIPLGCHIADEEHGRRAEGIAYMQRGDTPAYMEVHVVNDARSPPKLPSDGRQCDTRQIPLHHFHIVLSGIALGSAIDTRDTNLHLLRHEVSIAVHRPSLIASSVFLAHPPCRTQVDGISSHLLRPSRHLRTA